MARWAQGDETAAPVPTARPAPAAQQRAAQKATEPTGSNVQSAERQKIDAVIYEQTENLGWTPARCVLWLREVFAVNALKDLTDQQAVYARELLIDWASQGEDVYKAALADLRAKGRAK